jgi:glycosyltransferase involved in cell wall biosynthesis
VKVLVWLNGTGVFGGHGVQLTQLMPELTKLGVDVEFTEKQPKNLRSIDLVHGLGLTTPQVRACRQAGCAVVLSTVYWSTSYTHTLLRIWEQPQLQRRLRLFVALGVAGLRLRYLEKLHAMAGRLDELALSYESADVLLPNARGEAIALRAELGVTTPTIVVPNGADPAVFSPPAHDAQRRGVLAVGRFEPHKDQLGLIKALADREIPLTIVGPAHPDHPDYARACELAAGPNVTLVIDRLPHAELARLYQACEVHVLASWFETTGLVSLEAALCGAKIVSTDRGYATEYLQGDAWYCDPARPSTIRRAVVAALAAPIRSTLRDRVLAQYTWHHAAEATFRGYTTALANRRPG